MPSEKVMKWKASWIWIDSENTENYVYAHARKAFKIKSKPEDAVINISANNLYRLHVNGVFIEQGPDRSDPSCPYYDTYGIGKMLKKGDNIISVDLYCITEQITPGGNLQRHWALYGGTPAFICELSYKDGKSRKKIATDASWKMIKSPCWREDATKITRFLGFVEHFDANAARKFGNYKDKSYDDSAWETPVCLGVPPAGKMGMPIKKEIPPLKRVFHKPVGVGSIQHGDTHVKNENLHLGMIFFGDNIITTPTSGSPTAMTFDFGRTMGGGIEVKLKNCSGGRMEIYYGDSQRRQLSEIIELPDSGALEFTSFDWRGTRYVEIQFYDIAKELSLDSVKFIERQYQFDYEADFETDDEKFGEIWRMCKSTAHIAAKDHLQDCITREQALWIEDVYVHSRSLMACFGDTAASKRAVVQSLRGITPQGNIPVPGPAFAGYNRANNPPRWGGQALLIPNILEKIHQYDADTAFLSECAPKVKKILDYMALHKDKTGILDGSKKGAPGIEVFGGWASAWKNGRTTIINVQYVSSLRAAAYVFQKIGDEKGAGRYRRLADKTSAFLFNQFYSEKDNLFFDGDRDGKPFKRFSPTYNATAILAGILPRDKWAVWADAMLNHPTMAMMRSPYDAGVATEAYYHIGRPDLAEDLIEKCWGTFVDMGMPTVPERWFSDHATTLFFDYQCQSSSCHPYSTAPAYLFQEYILGVKPLQTGYSEIEIAPVVNSIRLARGRINTPFGELFVYWRKNKNEWYMEVVLPENVVATVKLPRFGWGAGRMTCDGEIIWEDDGIRRFKNDSLREKHADTLREVSARIAGKGRHLLKMEVI